MHMIDVMAKLKEIAESGYDNEDIQRGIDAAATQVFAEEEFQMERGGMKKKRSMQKEAPTTAITGDEPDTGGSYTAITGDPEKKPAKKPKAKLPKRPAVDAGEKVVPFKPMPKPEPKPKPKPKPIPAPGKPIKQPITKPFPDPIDPKDFPDFPMPGEEPLYKYPGLPDDPIGDPMPGEGPPELPMPFPDPDPARGFPMPGTPEFDELPPKVQEILQGLLQGGKPSKRPYDDDNQENREQSLAADYLKRAAESVEQDAVKEVHEDVEEDTSLADILKLAGRSGVIGMKAPTAMISESLELDEQEIEEQAVEETVAVPVQALEELMRLAGYENYEAKIDEYENDPEPEYMDSEEQMMGLSGGLNGPKKMYPASADGDNPMDQEPREIEESLADSFYTQYSQMIADLKQEDD